MTAKDIAEALRAQAKELERLAKILDPPKRGRPPLANRDVNATKPRQVRRRRRTPTRTG